MDKTSIYLIVDKNTNDYMVTRARNPLLVGMNFPIGDHLQKISVDKFEEIYGKVI